MKKVGMYGNYQLRNKLMELITFLKNQYNVVVIPGKDQKYFKQLEQDILKLATDMVILL